MSNTPNLTEPQGAAPQPEEEAINMRDFLALCLQKWKWFVFSICACVAIACVYILTTPKSYTRDASVMIKDEDNSTGGMSSVLSDLGFGGSKAEVRNELIAFQSPALLSEVIKDLNLDINYTTRPKLRDVALYGDSLPVKLEFIDAKPVDMYSFDMQLKGNGTVVLSDFRNKLGKLKGNDLTARIGSTVNTPAGRIKIMPGPDFRFNDDRLISIEKKALADAITEYKKKLNMTLSDEKASVIDISITDENLQRASDVIDNLIAAYNANWVDDKNQMATATSEFITDRLASLQQELGDADRDVTAYQSKHLLPDLKTKTSLAMKTNTENEKLLTELGMQLQITRDLRRILNDRGAAGKLMPANTGIDNKAIEEMVMEYNKKQMERDNLEARASSNNPMVTDLDRDLTSMRAALLSSVDSYIQGLATQIAGVMRADAVSTSKVAEAPEQAMQLLGFERQRGIKQELYLFLLKKREENELSRAFTAYNTRIITPPMGSDDPTKPQKMVVLILAFLVGLILPAIIIFIQESTNTLVRSRSDIEGLRTPYMGEIPLSDTMRRGRLRRALRKLRDTVNPKKHAGDLITPPELVVRSLGRNIVNEAFRSLRTNLEFMTGDIKGTPVIMTTSFNPGSGKSFVTLNLASAMAVKHKGSKVLVIDLDMRRGSVSGVVGNPPRGIADYLAGASDNIDTLIHPTEVDGLSILPVGTVPPNPSELLYSPRLKEAIDHLKEEYDYIFLDCAPSEIVTDAAIITKFANVTLFVVRAGLLDRRLLPRIDHYYNTHHFSNLTLVLNGTTSSDSPYGKYYGSNYYHKEDK